MLEAVEATRRVVATNSNLGLILLLAPLAAVPAGVPLAPGVASVLEATTHGDARLVYHAIRLARPGGLGSAPEQDVADEPTVTLLDAMRLAAEHDLIARQYANGFAEVFDDALVELRSALAAGRSLETAIVAASLMILGAPSRYPDRPQARASRGRGRLAPGDRGPGRRLARSRGQRGRV